MYNISLVEFIIAPLFFIVNIKIALFIEKSPQIIKNFVFFSFHLTFFKFLKQISADVTI